MGVELEAKVNQVLSDDEHLGSVDVSTDQETRVGSRELESVDRKQSSPVGLVDVLSESSDLTGRSHLDTPVSSAIMQNVTPQGNSQEGVGSRQTSPGELRHLDGDVIPLLLHQVDGLGDINAHDGGGGDVNEVGTEDLGDEGERPRSTQVALDNLELGILASDGGLSDNLHVERTGDVEGLADLLSNLLQSVEVLLGKGEGREDESGITRVNTGVLDVLGDGVDEELSVVRDGININLLGVVDELRDDDGVERRNVGGGRQVVLQLRLVVDDVHSSTRQDVRRSDQDRVSGTNQRCYFCLG